MTSREAPTVIQWIVDTRKLWLIDGKDGSVADLKVRAARALLLLSEDESSRALKFYFPKDAKMAIVSHLLKRMAIVALCNVPWNKAIVARRANHKPYFAGEQSNSTINFNLSHQAGIVTLVATTSSFIDVGIDVVCVNERENGGKNNDFFDWVNLHADVFHPNEMEYIRRSPQNLNLDVPPALEILVSACKHRGQMLRVANYELASSCVVDAKIRRFYAAWCLREAFIKMQGEALLADWLKELEFRKVRAPRPQLDAPPEDVTITGEIITDFKVFLKEEAYTDVLIDLRALGQNYMVATVMHSDSAEEALPASLPGFTALEEHDIYAAADRV